MMAYYAWDNKEQLLEDLKLSSSICDFLGKRNLVATSGNYHTFKKWMKVHDVNAEEFFISETKVIKAKNKIIKLSREEIFVVNSKADRQTVKNAIIKYKLLEYKCSMCGNCGSWNGANLSLQLEHKNGDNTDNRVENLEYLCPNCHSQTLTYGSKNKHNKIFEERIEDLVIFNKQVLRNNEYILLAKKWQISTEGVKNWLRLYSEKIVKQGIDIQHEIHVPNRSNLSIESYKQRFKDLKTISKLGQKEKDNLSKKWNISTHAVRKWIKENDKDFFKEHYSLSYTEKANNYLDELQQNVSKILDESKLKNNLDMERLLLLFNNNKGACVSYLRRKFTEDYNHLKSFNIN